MKAILLIVIFAITAYHALRLILTVLLSKLIVFSKIGMTRMFFDPKKGTKAITGTLKSILKHGAWTAAGCLTIFLMLPH